jgi:hypothetical protein
MTITLTKFGSSVFRNTVFAALFGFGSVGFAQINNQGNLYVADQGVLYLDSGAFNIGPSSSTTTSKTDFNYGKIVMGESSTTITGATNGVFIDGFVGSRKNAAFIGEVGSSGVRQRVRVVPSANFGVDMAAFRANPSVFGTALADPVTAVSTIEYWKVIGSPNTELSLAWVATSGVAALTENNLNNLLIVGWNGAAWVEIPATVDAAPFFGGASSTLTTGSIKTNAAIDLTPYSAFTLGAKNTLSSSDFSGGIQTIYLNNNQLNIVTSDEMQTVQVYDVTGRMVANYDAKSQTVLSRDFSHATGVYVVNIKYTSGTTVTRKLINK